MTAGIVNLLVASRASGRREIEQGPEWFDRPEVTRILSITGLQFLTAAELKKFFGLRPIAAGPCAS